MDWSILECDEEFNDSEFGKMSEKEMTEEERYAKEREAEEHLASLLQWNADAEFVSFGRIIF